MDAYVSALVLTIIIEISTVSLLGFRDKRFLKSVVLVNIITNPLLNIFFALTADTFYKYGLPYLLLLEILVVFIEYLILKMINKDCDLPFLKISFIMNTTSFLIGMILFW